jgi:hypothetical protein
VMKDALTAAYGDSTPIDYYSYEPFQVTSFTFSARVAFAVVFAFAFAFVFTLAFVFAFAFV